MNLRHLIESFPSPDSRRRLSGGVTWTLFGLLAAFLVVVLFEAWVQILLSTAAVEQGGRLRVEVPGWPKALKNGVYIALFVLTLLKITLDRRWTEFRTKADIAIAVLGLVFVISGLAGGSSAPLIGQAVYVYLRGAIVFYTWRALDPPLHRVRPIVWVVGGIIVLNALIATVQMVFGYQTYRELGWVDMTWAKIDRAHALVDHPNHLGHLTAVLLLGLVAWFICAPRVNPLWWVLFAIVALGLAASQSRESIVGVAAGIVVIWVLRRGRRVAAPLALVLAVAVFTVPLIVDQKNRAELARRLRGVSAAVATPSGAEGGGNPCVAGNPNCTPGRPTIPSREIRVLYAQQGFRLWLSRPVLGYGVGQFGGIVAYQDDPQWYQDRRFGPRGFNMHGANQKQVDSFWLHLLVETGLVGVVAYLFWMFFLGFPLLKGAWRRRDLRGEPFVLLGVAVLVFAALVAFLSPILEDPLFPPLMFSIVGLGWVVLGRAQASRANGVA